MCLSISKIKNLINKPGPRCILYTHNTVVFPDLQVAVIFILFISKIKPNKRPSVAQRHKHIASEIVDIGKKTTMYFMFSFLMDYID